MKQTRILLVLLLLISPFLLGVRRFPPGRLPIMPVDTYLIDAGNRDGVSSYDSHTDSYAPIDDSGNILYVDYFVTGPSPFGIWWRTTYLVFDGLSPNDVVQSAYLNLIGQADCSGGNYGDNVTARVYGVLDTNITIPPPIKSYIRTLPRTTANVDWIYGPNEGCDDVLSTSPDISSILNEIRQQSGFDANTLFMLQVDYISSDVPSLANGRLFGSFENGDISYLTVTSLTGRARIIITDEVSPIETMSM